MVVAVLCFIIEGRCASLKRLGENLWWVMVVVYGYMEVKCYFLRLKFCGHIR